MEEAYNQALQKIKELKNVTVKQWNELAMKEKMLSTESLKYISQKNFKTLCRETRK